MFVVGTAGHVDHGKSTLIEALTGIDPDRLDQEKERGMTIELGFAWLTLPAGLEVSIVDVPGHERFIKNMLMGVGGIDVALLVVAADEGVMPQTREHLAILDLLQVGRGVVAISKRDLVDEEWLELVEADIEEALAGACLAGSPMIAVSAQTGQGLDELLTAIESALKDLPEKRDVGRPRLPVDRSFTMSGFGTVVTGTLVDGRLAVGNDVEILPSGIRARVRGLQTHRQAETEALPGTRVAVNLSGVSYDQIRRGDVLTSPRWLRPTTAVDVELRVLKDAPRAVKHNAAIAFYTGSSETLGRVRLLDANELPPGSTGWAQIKLERPVAVVKDDFFVIRDTVTTLGGGVIVEPHAPRHRRFHGPTIKRLHTLRRGSEREILVSTLELIEPSTPAQLATAAGVSRGELESKIAALIESGEVVALGTRSSGLLYSAAGWGQVVETAREALAAYHRRYPLRPGMPKEELRNRLGMRGAAFALALSHMADAGLLESDEAVARAPGFRPELGPEHAALADAYLARLASSPYAPPTDDPIDSEVLNVLVEQGKVVKASGDVVFLRSAYEEMADRIVERARRRGSISLADVRDMFGTSRKYTLAVLEHMDRQQITRRVGDDRVLR